MEKNNVLLFGNGLNRISNGDSWSKILNDVSNSPILSSLPYPLQYDFILFDNKNALETQDLSGRQSKLKKVLVNLTAMRYMTKFAQCLLMLILQQIMIWL